MALRGAQVDEPKASARGIAVAASIKASSPRSMLRAVHDDAGRAKRAGRLSKQLEPAVAHRHAEYSKNS